MVIDNVESFARQFNGHQECPTCEGLLNREHFGWESWKDMIITRLWCEHCRSGREDIWVFSRGEWKKEPNGLEFNKDTDPVVLYKFMQRLKECNSVPA